MKEWDSEMGVKTVNQFGSPGCTTHCWSFSLSEEESTFWIHSHWGYGSAAPLLGDHRFPSISFKRRVNPPENGFAGQSLRRRLPVSVRGSFRVWALRLPLRVGCGSALLTDMIASDSLVSRQWPLHLPPRLWFALGHLPVRSVQRLSSDTIWMGESASCAVCGPMHPLRRRPSLGEVEGQTPLH